MKRKTSNSPHRKSTNLAPLRVPEFQLLFTTPYIEGKRKLAVTCNVSTMHQTIPPNGNLPPATVDPVNPKGKKGKKRTKAKFAIPQSVLPFLDSQRNFARSKKVASGFNVPYSYTTGYFPKAKSPVLGDKRKTVKSLSGRYKPVPNLAAKSSRLLHATKSINPWQERIKNGLSNYISVICSSKYKYIIHKGNNSGLIRRVMGTRSWWVEIPMNSPSYHFLWQPCSLGINFDSLYDPSHKQVVNHLENHREISRKSNLFLNLLDFAEQNHENVFNFVPITFYVELNGNKLSNAFQHFVSLYQALVRGKTKSSASFHNKLAPPSYTSANGTAKYAKYTLPLCHFVGHNLWILKPTGLNRGRGIHVFHTLDSLRDLIISYARSEKSSSLSTGFIIQKYIESPMLLNGRKFDIRMWALVTGELDGYLFREGYIRTSSTPFVIDRENVDNKFVHLTNNAVQKYSTSYGSFEDGNQMSFERFKEYFKKGYFENVILPQIKELVIKSLLSVRKKLVTGKHKDVFEIFGYDFMIDTDYNVWIIEVNTNPCLEESSKLLKSILPRMVDDAFKLTLDQAFPKLKEHEEEKNRRKFPVKGYSDDFNMWYAHLLTKKI